NSHRKARSKWDGISFVLNAFRHHRNSHTPISHKPTAEILCAQRLSASSEFSRMYREVFRLTANVLNAFWHHRNSHKRYTSRYLNRSKLLKTFKNYRNSNLS